MKSSYVIPVAIVVAGAIIAGAVYASMPKRSMEEEADRKENLAEHMRPVGTDDHILGNPAAKVMLVEYADFNCSYCKTYNDTLHQIVATAGADGTVAWVFRYFPQPSTNPTALSDARAVECAARSGGSAKNELFWRFAYELYARKSADTSYGTLAASVGIPGDAFASCYSNMSKNVSDRIEADRQNALQVGATTAPYTLLVVAGKPSIVLDGAYPYDAVRALIDQALGD